MWKGGDSTFPYIDSHNKNYNVRDNSDWEKTLKPRLRERTVSSRALREEIDYGINNQGLPVIVIYPDYDSKESLLKDGLLKQEIRDLWDKLPIFRNSMNKVPTLHVPMKKELIIKALKNEDFMVSTKVKSGCFKYPV